MARPNTQPSLKLSENIRSTMELLLSRGIPVTVRPDAEAQSSSASSGKASYKFVKDDPEFQRFATNNQWRDRKSRGLPSRMCIFRFLKDTYGNWLGHMNQADLKAVDIGAWRALQNRLQTDEMPSWLYLPKLSDRYLPTAGSPEYESVLEARRMNKQRMRLLRGLPMASSDRS